MLQSSLQVMIILFIIIFLLFFYPPAATAAARKLLQLPGSLDGAAAQVQPKPASCKLHQNAHCFFNIEVAKYYY